MRGIQVIQQREASECGLACVAMIAVHFGRDVNLPGLRARFGVSTRGINLRSLLDIAGQLGLRGRPIRAELSALQHLKLPAIAHWDLDHFVVITAVGRDRVTVADPARGTMIFPLEEVSSRFTGIIVEFTPGSDQVGRQKRTSLKVGDLVRLLPGILPKLGQLAALSLLLQAFYLALPLFTQAVIDGAVPSADIDLLNLLAIAFAGAYALSISAAVVSNWAILHMGQRAAVDLSASVVHHLLRLPMKWHYSRRTGDTIAKLGTQARVIELFTTQFPALLVDGAVAITAALMLFAYDFRLAAVVVVGIAASMLATAMSYPRLRRLEDEALRASIEEQTIAVDTVRSVQAIRMFGRERENEAVWQNGVVAAANARVRAGTHRNTLRLVTSLIQAAQIVIVIYLTARISIGGSGMTVGAIFAFLFFRQTVNDRVLSLVDRIVGLGLTSLQLEHLSDILMEKADEESGAGHPATITGAIRLENVWLKYGEHDQAVVRGLNLDVAPGEMVAIVGPTGGGKTSVVKLISGLVPATSGRVVVDGVELSAFGAARWRRSIGAVMQDDALISGTVADNIAFFDVDIDMERVEEAARLAALDKDIDQFPMRYWTWIGDMGSSLSGGQRQRLLIARALYARPQVLLMDEGTANLDPATELAIVETIASLPITRIVVAHRPALVEKADRVIEIRGGVLSTDIERAEASRSAVAAEVLSV